MTQPSPMRHCSTTGLVTPATFIQSPNCDNRPADACPEAIIIHCISLPPGEYQNNNVIDFFTNNLNITQHEYFSEISHLTVSAHFVIQRNGNLIQFVPTHLRAWHAGESMCLGRPAVNNFSIGIELEGIDTDADGYMDTQYETLTTLISCLKSSYPLIDARNIFAHSDIAPERKTDPGQYFDWGRVF